MPASGYFYISQRESPRLFFTSDFSEPFKDTASLLTHRKENMNIDLNIPIIVFVVWHLIMFLLFIESDKFLDPDCASPFFLFFITFLINAILEFSVYMYANICSQISFDTSFALYERVFHICIVASFLILSMTLTVILLMTIIFLLKCIFRTRKAMGTYGRSV